MDEFNSRMETQRAILQVANRQAHLREELCGLSKKAIERWLDVHQIQPTSEVATILFQISSKLFFLSSKSQEQVTDEYKLRAEEVQSLKTKLEFALSKTDQAV